MTTPSAVLLIVVVLSAPSASVRICAQEHAVPSSPLDAFQTRTGWIRLGEVTPNRKKWATGGDPLALYNSGTFEYVDHEVEPTRVVLPRRGDRIRLKVRQPIVILDYKTDGERHVDEPPMLHRPMETRDDTGVWLDSHLVVQVRSVQVSKVVGLVRFVWAQVTPAIPASK
jgi:hypothetical protein